VQGPLGGGECAFRAGLASAGAAGVARRDWDDLDLGGTRGHGARVTRGLTTMATGEAREVAWGVTGCALRGARLLERRSRKNRTNCFLCSE
jgi:hypothetical protein